MSQADIALVPARGTSSLAATSTRWSRRLTRRCAGMAQATPTVRVRPTTARTPRRSLAASSPTALLASCATSVRRVTASSPSSRCVTRPASTTGLRSAARPSPSATSSRPDGGRSERRGFATRTGRGFRGQATRKLATALGQHRGRCPARDAIASGLERGACEPIRRSRSQSGRGAKRVRNDENDVDLDARSDGLLTAEEVAAMLRMKRVWVYAETRRGAIPHVRLGRYVRYRRSAVTAWVHELEQGARTARHAPPRRAA